MKRILVYLVLIAALFSCKEEYPYSDVPEISLVSYSPQNVQALSEPLKFTIDYVDGDGDLGENHTDSTNLHLIDNRIGIRYSFRIQELVPGGSSVPISGRLSFSIPNTFMTTTDSTEQVNYSIYLYDRAGNRSNTLVTGPVTVYR